MDTRSRGPHQWAVISTHAVSRGLRSLPAKACHLASPRLGQRKLAAAALIALIALCLADRPLRAEPVTGGAPLRVTPASDVAPAMPRLGRERSIRRPLWLRSKATRFRPDTPRRRMVRARRRALFAIRRLERDLETLRSAPPPGLVSHQARQV